MPVQPIYPGTYVEEIPSGVRTIAGVPTSVTAFVGEAKRGPVNQPVTIVSFSHYERRYGGLSAGSEMSYAIRQFFLNGGAEAIVVRVASNAVAASTVLQNGSSAPVDVLRVTATDEGLEGNTISIGIEHHAGGLFNLVVNHGDAVNASAAVMETFSGLSMDPSDFRFVERAVNNSSDWVRVTCLAPTATPVGAPVTAEAGLLPAPVTDRKLQGGNEQPVTDSNRYDVYAGGESSRSGIYALDAVDMFNILCLPGVYDARIIVDSVTYCTTRRAFLIVDAPPAIVQPGDMAIFMVGNTLPKSDSAALYYPWTLVADPLNGGALRPTAPSGTIAGLYARVDVNRGVWKAPAGTTATLTGVQQLAYAVTDRDNALLDPVGVNCLRVFTGMGPICWGGRTLAGADANASEWKYIPVKRTALYIEESLYRGLKWVVFEPNGEPLWAQIRLAVGVFLQGLFRQGAFQGAKDSDAYFVRCDSATTTPNDIGLGVVNISVGFAPVKPAEFVVLTLQLLAGQMQQ